jgi:hypothetical protein
LPGESGEISLIFCLSDPAVLRKSRIVAPTYRISTTHPVMNRRQQTEAEAFLRSNEYAAARAPDFTQQPPTKVWRQGAALGGRAGVTAAIPASQKCGLESRWRLRKSKTFPFQALQPR